MTDTGGMDGLPPKGTGADKRTSKLDTGRIRLCGDLIVSVNRSWRIEGPTKDPPAAAFKAMAPLVFWAHGADTAGDIYVAAVAAHDAYWLGFETDGAPHAMILDINGRNALNGGAGDARPGAEANFLLVPDLPWFDATHGPDGRYHQLVPSYGSDTGPGAILRLTAYPLTDDVLTRRPDADADEVQPLYGAENPPATAPAHPWVSRALAKPDAAPKACGSVSIYLARPEQFQSLTGEKLDLAEFADKGEPPAPHDPFQ